MKFIKISKQTIKTNFNLFLVFAIFLDNYFTMDINQKKTHQNQKKATINTNSKSIKKAIKYKKNLVKNKNSIMNKASFPMEIFEKICEVREGDTSMEEENLGEQSINVHCVDFVQEEYIILKSFLDEVLVSLYNERIANKKLLDDNHNSLTILPTFVTRDQIPYKYHMTYILNDEIIGEKSFIHQNFRCYFSDNFSFINDTKKYNDQLMGIINKNEDPKNLYKEIVEYQQKNLSSKCIYTLKKIYQIRMYNMINQEKHLPLKQILSEGFLKLSDSNSLYYLHVNPQAPKSDDIYYLSSNELYSEENMPLHNNVNTIFFFSSMLQEMIIKTHIISNGNEDSHKFCQLNYIIDNYQFLSCQIKKEKTYISFFDNNIQQIITIIEKIEKINKINMDHINTIEINELLIFLSFFISDLYNEYFMDISRYGVTVLCHPLISPLNQKSKEMVQLFVINMYILNSEMFLLSKALAERINGMIKNNEINKKINLKFLISHYKLINQTNFFLSKSNLNIYHYLWFLQVSIQLSLTSVLDDAIVNNLMKDYQQFGILISKMNINVCSVLSNHEKYWKPFNFVMLDNNCQNLYKNLFHFPLTPYSNIFTQNIHNGSSLIQYQEITSLKNIFQNISMQMFNSTEKINKIYQKDQEEKNRSIILLQDDYNYACLFQNIQQDFYSHFLPEVYFDKINRFFIIFKNIINNDIMNQNISNVKQKNKKIENKNDTIIHLSQDNEDPLFQPSVALFHNIKKKITQYQLSKKDLSNIVFWKMISVFFINKHFERSTMNYHFNNQKTIIPIISDMTELIENFFYKYLIVKPDINDMKNNDFLKQNPEYILYNGKIIVSNRYRNKDKTMEYKPHKGYYIKSTIIDNLLKFNLSIGSTTLSRELASKIDYVRTQAMHMNTPMGLSLYDFEKVQKIIQKIISKLYPITGKEKKEIDEQLKFLNRDEYYLIDEKKIMLDKDAKFLLTTISGFQWLTDRLSVDLKYLWPNHKEEKIIDIFIQNSNEKSLLDNSREYLYQRLWQNSEHKNIYHIDIKEIFVEFINKKYKIFIQNNKLPININVYDYLAINSFEKLTPRMLFLFKDYINELILRNNYLNLKWDDNGLHKIFPQYEQTHQNLMLQYKVKSDYVNKDANLKNELLILYHGTRPERFKDILSLSGAISPYQKNQITTLKFSKKRTEILVKSIFKNRSLLSIICKFLTDCNLSTSWDYNLLFFNCKEKIRNF